MFPMSQNNCNILCWNVRGLNSASRRASTRNTVLSSGATSVCLQETKISLWTPSLVGETLGSNFAKNYTMLPANGVRGGILLAANEHYFQLQNFHGTTYTVSADVIMRADNTTWTITGVYGPQDNHDKEEFLEEIKQLKARSKSEWMILGDFNLIYKAEDKNNNRLNRHLMTCFKDTLDEVQLMEVDLRGRSYTWSNEQNDPTFTRIDRFFGSTDWHLLFPNIDLQALPTQGLDHAPLLLTGNVTRQTYSGFCFESFWISMPGFHETVQNAWAQPVDTQDAILRMHVKLLRTAKALKLWRRQSLGNIPLRLQIAKQLLLIMDTEQETRPLTQDELVFRRYLKAKTIGLAAILRSRA